MDKKLSVGGVLANCEFSGVISGEGSLEASDSIWTSTLILSGANTFTGGLVVKDSYVEVTGSLADTCNVLVKDASDAEYKVSSGDVIGGFTIASGGHGKVHLNGKSLALTGDSSIDSTVNGIYGTGDLILAGTDKTFDFCAGENTYSGGTTFNGSGATVKIANNESLGTGAIKVLQSTTLEDTAGVTLDESISVALNQTLKVATTGSHSTSLSGIISGDGSLEYDDGGNEQTLTLSNANTFSGNLTVTSGTVNASGIMSDNLDVIVKASGTYTSGITDTISSLTCESGAKVNIADAVTLTTTGNVDLSGTILTIAASSGASYGKIVSSGTVTATDQTSVAIDVLGDYYMKNGDTLTIIDATAGTFTGEDQITEITDNSAVLDFTVDEVSDDKVVKAVVSRMSGGYAAAAKTLVNKNETAALNVLESLHDTTDNEEMRAVLTQLDSMGEEDLAQAAAQLSPQSMSGSINAGVSASSSFTDFVKGHGDNLRSNAFTMRSVSKRPSGPSGPTAKTPSGISVWADTYGTHGDQNDLEGKMGYKWKTYGGAVGIDRVFGSTTLGASVGYSETSVEADKYSSSEIESYNVGVHATHTIGSLWTSGGLSYSSGDISNSRNLVFLQRVALSSTKSTTWTTYGGVGVDITAWNLTLIPHAILRYSNYSQDGYTESGAGAANLHVGDFSQDSITSTIGIDLSYRLSPGLVAKANAALVHDYGSEDSSISSSFSEGDTFKTEGLTPDQSSCIFGFGLEGQIGRNSFAYGDYKCEKKDESKTHNVTAGMRFDF